MRTKAPEEVASDAFGVIESRKRQATGTVVTIYDAEVAGFDTAGGPFVTVCEDHGTITNHASVSQARKHAPVASGCEPCQEYISRPPKEKTPKLTQGEHDLIGYALSEATVYRRAAAGSYINGHTREYYRGMAAAMSRMADDVLKGKHRQ